MPPSADNDADNWGLKVVKWKVNHTTSVIRQFFVKAHDVPEATRRKPVGKTLLVHNVPPFVEEKQIRRMFKIFGSISEIFFHSKPTTAIPDPKNKFFPLEKDIIRGFKVAYVVFKDTRAVKEILALNPEEVDPLICGPVTSGLKHYMKQYNSKIIDEDVLEEDIKNYMIEFDKEEIKRKAAEKLSADQEDDEGWTLVTSKGKKAGIKRKESTQNRLKEKKRRMEQGIVNFTPAQLKASKVKQLDDLKKKFEQDKLKIELLKQQRKFKPF